MRNVLKIIIHIAVLYVIFLVGNGIQQYFNLFIPGSVIGMLLLFVLLMTGVIKASWIEEGARTIINHLALFFIPATVGVINYFDLFAGKGFLLVIIVLLSTVMVIVTSGHVSQILMRRKEGNQLQEEERSHG
ncbi:CidA/LrgA family holin-like protein [Virgibacillus sp. NKC19-16]|uniref:CidA/LrgA family protein n=1 Tax=Virgibacillus salidurans TaxID=2831673 RepID=UPI001F327C86|nr:CidA/LrgA family holin-like protein [Virgibacillus sp. NKC19-16]UJL46277.1 CidA/LrgA family holin-like protein [Virgibacillus sp. NKC19-16]